jgi:hypothetical protein
MNFIDIFNNARPSRSLGHEVPGRALSALNPPRSPLSMVSAPVFGEAQGEMVPQRRLIIGLAADGAVVQVVQMSIRSAADHRAARPTAWNHGYGQIKVAIVVAVVLHAPAGSGARHADWARRRP